MSDHPDDFNLLEEPDFDAPLDPQEEAATIKALEKRNKLRILIPLLIVIGLSYLLFGGPLKKPSDPGQAIPASEKS